MSATAADEEVMPPLYILMYVTVQGVGAEGGRGGVFSMAAINRSSRTRVPSTTTWHESKHS